MMFDDAGIDLKQYYRLILRNKTFFFVPCVVVFCLVALSSLFFPKIYESTTVIQVQEQQPNPLGTERLVREDLQARLKTLTEVALSRPHLLETIRKLNLDVGIESDVQREALIGQIRKSVSVRRRGNDLFEIAAENQDPVLAMRIASTIVNLFMDENLSMKRGQAYASVEFIEDQLQLYKGKLEASEAALSEFKQAHIGEMPGEQNTNLVQLERLRDSLAQVNMELQEAISRKRFVESRLATEKPMVVSMTTGEAASVEEKIAILQFELSQLLANYTEKHPDIVRIRAEIDKLQKQTMGQGAGAQPLAGSGNLSTLNPIHQNLKEQLNNIHITIGTLQTKKAVLTRRIGDFEVKVVSIPEQEKELAVLERDYSVNERIYQMLLMKYEEARISKQLEFTQGGTRFQVIEPAIVPIAPIKPDRLMFLGAALALGCAAGAGTVYGKEYLDTSTRGVQQAESVYQVPVLAAIPEIVTKIELVRKRKKKLRWVAFSVLFTAALISAVVAAVYRGL
jgi:polysaccharide chain length determinant protein (PEP-CTERM system associated)